MLGWEGSVGGHSNIYCYVCVCECVCERERDRERGYMGPSHLGLERQAWEPGAKREVLGGTGGISVIMVCRRCTLLAHGQ
jgi:hypothetical protein